LANQERIIYSDIRTNLDIHPVKGDIVLLKNIDAVKTSIRNILLTRPYERPRKPDFGAGLSAYLFEDMSPVTEQSIKGAIELAIENYEKRANVIEVYVTALYDKNAYAATIIFSIVNDINPAKLDLLLERVR
jgi:phage baseplate assembly protein W